MSAVGVDGGVLFGAFAFRRGLYDEIGGFSKIGHSLTEDLAFARSIRRRGARVRYMLSKKRGGLEPAPVGRRSWFARSA